MYKAIEAVEQLRREKMRILEQVYTVKNLDKVYERQTVLNAMAINIYTDCAGAVLPALKEDEINSTVWANVAGRLGKLDFIGIPSASDLRSKYESALNEAASSSSAGDYTISPEKPEEFSEKPKTKTAMRIQKKKLPKLIMLLAVQGIAVPLVLEMLGAKWHVLVKIIEIANGAAMVIEIVKYFVVFEKTAPIKESPKRKNAIPEKKPSGMEKYDDLYAKAIEQVQQDNAAELNRWFDYLGNVVEQEIEKDKKEMESEQ